MRGDREPRDGRGTEKTSLVLVTFPRTFRALCGSALQSKMYSPFFVSLSPSISYSVNVLDTRSRFDPNSREAAEEMHYQIQRDCYAHYLQP